MALKTSLVITGDSAQAAAALAQVEQGLDRASAAARRNAAANDEAGAKVVVSARQAAAGYTNLGRQIQDVTVQLQGGANIGTIISQQGGQVADAVAQMGGRFAGFASFMAGPVGSVIIVVAGLLANQLIPALFGSGQAADQAKGKFFDLSGGLAALETNALAAKDAMDKLRESAAKQSAAASAASANTIAMVTAMGEIARLDKEIASARLAGFRGEAAQASSNANLDRLLAQRATAQKTLQRAQSDLADIRARADAQAIADANRERLNDLAKASRKKGPDPAKAAAREARAEQLRIDFGADAARQIAGIKDQFSDLTPQVAKTNTAMRELDKIAAAIAQKKPPNLKQLLADIAEARTAIQADINKPFEDYLEKAREAAEINSLIAQGRYDEAEALKSVLAIEANSTKLKKEQLEAVLATVKGAREFDVVIRDQNAIIQSQVRAVYDLRGALVETVADTFRGRFSIERVLSSIGNSYINITAQKIVEATFGNTLRELERQASALDPVKQAGQQMADQFRSGGAAVQSFADVVNQARAQIAGGGAGTSTSSSATGGTSTDDPNQIVVQANRAGTFTGAGGFFTNIITGLTGALRLGLPPVFGDVLAKSLTKLEKGLPQALAGAFTGASASRILLGDRGTTGTIGGAIGGALGQKFGEKFLSSGLEKIGGKVLGSLGGPIGSVVGGLLGGLIGGIFATKPRGSGTVTQSSVSVSANRDSVKSSLNTLGGQLQQSVQSIADRLGGTVGNYEVGFGQYKDYYQVSKTGKDPFLGQTYYQNKSPNALYDGKDAAAALSAAISDAVADGAIQGISSRVAAALKSSSDIDKAVREAVKVQDLELALGGIGEELRRQFAQFEQQAKDRLRIAKQYGFDVVAVEKRNAEDRVKLQEKLLKQQVGSLQQLIDDLTSGSLFEGSAVDQRTALLAQISKARADANAGVEGAADTLNQLLQQFNSVSKNVYGTTGGFADDRQQILDIARDAIQKANQRVAEAQKVTDPALTETNNQLNESNDQLAKLSTQTGISIDLLRQLVANTAGGSNIGALIQRARFQ